MSFLKIKCFTGLFLAFSMQACGEQAIENSEKRNPDKEEITVKKSYTQQAEEPQTQENVEGKSSDSNTSVSSEQSTMTVAVASGNGIVVVTSGSLQPPKIQPSKPPIATQPPVVVKPPVSQPPVSQPPVSQPPVSQPALMDWENVILQAHNIFRQNEKANLVNLVWNQKLQALSQNWADKLKTVQNCSMTHRSSQERVLDGKPVGENLYWASSSRGGSSFIANGNQVLKGWGTDEKPYYNFSTKKCSSGAQCGHYTQVVWKDTTQVGCGRAKCGNSEVWVCNYFPAGNWNGRNPY
jgi:pathogenesis-related protein 1